MKGLKVTNNKYYYGSFLKSKSLKKIEYVHEPLGKPLGLVGFEEFDIFIVKEEKDRQLYWRISESYTGFRLYKSLTAETKPKAIANLLAKMAEKKITKKKFKDLVNASIAKWDLSPRFQ